MPMSKDYAKAFYHSKKWKDTQLSYMVSQNYVCERCGSLARIVHHKKYITPNNISDPDITLNWSNLEALCMNCHTNEHLKSGICSSEIKFADNGDLIKSPCIKNTSAVYGTESRSFKNLCINFYIKGD